MCTKPRDTLSSPAPGHTRCLLRGREAQARIPHVQDQQHWALIPSRHLSAVVMYLSINYYLTSSLAASFHHLFSFRLMTVWGWKAFFLSGWTKAIQWSEQQEVLKERYC